MSAPGDDDERVPLFGTWRNAYIVVVVIFVIDVAVFYWVSGIYT